MTDVQNGIECACAAVDGLAESFRELGQETLTGNEAAEVAERVSERLRTGGQMLEALAALAPERRTN